MTLTEATVLGREALWTVLLVGGPALLVTLAVGTALSVIQAVTQVHEQTLSFLPKLVAVAIVLAIGAGWMASELVRFGTRSFSHAATVGQP
ncbi:MAG: flagellar biosynthetic protein FliQ [Pseudomonadota bacterium]|nr:flagellar biosynthetic protein FliQ [Pseudomonadota bacterium]